MTYHCQMQSNHYNASTCELDVSVRLANSDVIREKATTERNHTCTLLLGSESDNTIIYKTRIRSVRAHACLYAYDVTCPR